MLGKTHYANGQKVYDLDGALLRYFYKSGALKAEGRYEGGMMQGEWRFYGETGVLLQTGVFRDNMKNGLWIRFNQEGQIVYREEFADGKKLRRTLKQDSHGK